MKHRCTPDRCWKVIKGKLVNVCEKCPEAALTAVLGYTPKSTYRLGSGEARARKSSSFQIPDFETRSGLRRGQLAKLIFLKGNAGERMWVQVSSHSGSGRKIRYTGKLKNKPIVVDLKFDEKITFGPQHVISVIAAHGKEYPTLSKAEKDCASEFIGEEMDALKEGRWENRKQAIAVGISRARRQC